MEESTPSSSDPSSENDELNENAGKSSKGSEKSGKGVTSGLPQTVTSGLKRKRKPVEDIVEKKDVDITEEKYSGRTRKRKIQDSLPTEIPDKKDDSSPSSSSDDAKATRGGKKLSGMSKGQEHSEAESNNNNVNENLKRKPKAVGDKITAEVKNEDVEESVEKEGDLPASDWKVGDLVWARVSGHSFWPSIITVDPEIGDFKRDHGRLKKLQLHVQFFGDNGKRSWLLSNCIIRFEGLEAFKQLSAKIQTEAKKSEKKLLAVAYNVKPKMQAKWDIAVKEAEAAQRKTRDERVEDFATQFPIKAKKKKTTKIASPPRKQKRLETNKGDQQKVNSDMVQEAGSSSMSNVESTVSARKKKNPKTGFFDYPPDFRVYRDKFVERLAQENPNETRKGIKKYLANSWKDMDDVDKAKYCKRIPYPPDAYETSDVSVTDTVTEDEDDVPSNRRKQKKRKRRKDKGIIYRRKKKMRYSGMEEISKEKEDGN